MDQATLNILKVFIPQVEGFHPKAVWDYKQYSYGYGTKAPNASATITKEAAFNEMVKVLQQNYNYLKPFIKVPLKPNQWAALLSFAYNTGNANAKNLVSNINKQDTTAVTNQMAKYINAGGKPLEGLKNRRAKEIALYKNNSAIVVGSSIYVLLFMALVVITIINFPKIVSYV